MKKVLVLIFMVTFCISACGTSQDNKIEANISQQLVDENLNNSVAQNTNDYELNNLPEANDFISDNIILLENNINTDEWASTATIKNNSKYYINGIHLGIRDKDTYEKLGHFQTSICLKPNTSVKGVFRYDIFKPLDMETSEFYIIDEGDKIYDGGKNSIDEIISLAARDNIIYADEIYIVLKDKSKNEDGYYATSKIKNNTDRKLVLPNTKINFYRPAQHDFSLYVLEDITLDPHQEVEYNQAVDQEMYEENDIEIMFTGCNMNSDEDYS